MVSDIKKLHDRIDALTEKVDLLMAENILLKSENALLKSENADLKSRLGQNSSNSHQPPSSDGLQKLPAFPRSKGLKKTGGQVGHRGKTLEMVSNPDEIIIHFAPFCPCCSKKFSLLDVEKTTSKRQLFDIPIPKLQVTEHQIGIITCCQMEHKGSFPESISHPVQYGTKIKALSVLLNVDYKIPFEKIEQLLGDLYHCSFNESTAISANLTCYEALETTEESIKAALIKSEVVHFDETGMRVEGKLHWFHVASTNMFTYLFVHTHRGKKALEATESLIKDFKNWAIHDCWASYFDFENCSHALCNAHILRELAALTESGTMWANEMKLFLLELLDETRKTSGTINKDVWQTKYALICQQADKEEPPSIKNKKGKPKNTKGRNLLNRLVKHQAGILAFAFVKGIPFTNNQAERDIRCLKTKQKVALSFRTFKGAQIYARIQSCVSSFRKNNKNVFLNLVDVFNLSKIEWAA